MMEERYGCKLATATVPFFPSHAMYRAMSMGETYGGSRREMEQNSKKLFRLDVKLWSVLLVVADWNKIVVASPSSSSSNTAFIAAVPEASHTFRVVVRRCMA